MTQILSAIHYLLALLLAPLLLGVINRTKSWFGGRVGPPLLQPYYDLWKLLHKGAVYSRTTTWIFRAGPIVGLACFLTALTLVPFGGAPALLSFPGDFLLFAYLLGLARFFTIAAALDTGSAFEGMGASREAWYSALAEPALLISLATLARQVLLVEGRTATLSLSEMYLQLTPSVWSRAALILTLVTAALIVVLLVENCRIPADDPNTHLELTMIHEVMVLDHGGPDLAFILYGAALKLWLIGSLLVGVLIPSTGLVALDSVLALAGMFALAVVVGVIESSMARLRLVRVPQMLVGAAALAALAFILERQGGMP
jgi:formate hydrogenlyase subunit 4